MTDPVTASSSKSEPEGLVLHGQPRRVTRFKRHVVIGTAVAVTIAVVGAAWFALRVPSLKGKASGGEPYNTNTKPAPAQLASLPSSYDKVRSPRLGPPLPGDLGAPILAHEKSLGMTPALGSFGPNSEEDAARAEQLRLAQLAQQAREAKVLFQTSGANPSPELSAPVASPQTISSQTANRAPMGGTLADDQNGQLHKIDFASRHEDDATYNTHSLQMPASAYELLAGTVIAASLITGLDSDLPGFVIAQITQDLFDSISGTVILVPRGSRLIGKVDSVVAFGQSRALVVWQRIVMPNGSSIEIDNLPATDTQGYTGLEDGVDYHTWQLIKGVAISTLLGVGTQLAVNNDNDNLLAALRNSAQNSTNQAGQQITQRNINLQPTLTVRPGWPLRAIVQKGLILPPYQN